MSPASPAHVQRVRVYWEDTDAGGIVFYANYLKFFERARTEWLRGLGYSQQAMMAQAQGSEGAAMFVVSDTQVRYVQPARLDDELDVTVVPVRLGSASMTIAQQALHKGTLLAEGTIRIACVHPRTLRPRRIPTDLLNSLQSSPA